MTAINWTNVTDFSVLPTLANTASDGTFWVGMLHMIWVILMAVTIQWGWEVALIVASFSSLILAFLMVYSGLIAWGYVAEFLGILFFMYLYTLWSGGRD